MSEICPRSHATSLILLHFSACDSLMIIHHQFKKYAWFDLLPGNFKTSAEKSVDIKDRKLPYRFILHGSQDDI